MISLNINLSIMNKILVPYNILNYATYIMNASVWYLTPSPKELKYSYEFNLIEYT